MVKCQALNDNGKRCNKPDTKLIKYFGDLETNVNKLPGWVAVYLCQNHRNK